MDAPPIWLILLGSSLFALLTRAKAVKHQRNHRLWFWMGFIFGIWGFIAFYMSKKPAVAPSVSLPKAASPLILEKGVWYYEEKQSVSGPVSAEYLLELFEKKQITLETLVWHEHLEEWKKLETFRG